MTDRSTVKAVFRLLGVQGIGPARARAVMRWCTKKGIALDEFIINPVTGTGGLSEKLVERLRSTPDNTERIVDKLESEGIRVLLHSDEEYPRSIASTLGDKAPPVLTVKGNLEILGRPAIGFCGSRKATKKGLGVAKDCAEQLSQKGICVVSGYAAGVDMAAHCSALQTNGTTTVVLAEGALSFRLKEEIRQVWDWERVAVVSEFLPEASWSVGNAMQRNSTICGLSQAMILIEARSKGGSAEAGRTCLQMQRPLFASVYENGSAATAGNQDVVREGATRLYKNRSSGRANLENVFELLRSKGFELDESNALAEVPATINAG